MMHNRNFALGGANLTPHYVRGIVDGEGCFSVGLSANKAPRTGYFTMLEFKVTSLSVIMNVIFPFFDANPLITAKCLNYKAFREIAMLMNSGAHLTAEGIEKIKIIKDSMNLKVSFTDKYKFMVNFPPVICAE